MKALCRVTQPSSPLGPLSFNHDRNQLSALLGECGSCILVGSTRAGTEVSLEMPWLQGGWIVRGIIQGDSRPRHFIPRLVDLFMAAEMPLTGSEESKEEGLRAALAVARAYSRRRQPRKFPNT